MVEDDGSDDDGCHDGQNGIDELPVEVYVNVKIKDQDELMSS